MSLFSVTSITNISIVDEAGVLNPNFLRLTLSEPPPENLDTNNVFFTSGNTTTVIPSSGIFPWQTPGGDKPLRKYQAVTGELLIIGGVPLSQSFTVKDVLDEEGIGSLLFRLRGKVEILRDSVNNPASGESGNYVVLNLVYDLAANNTSYVTNTGKIFLAEKITSLNVQDLIDFGFKNRFQEDIYAISNTLSLAFSRSKDLDYLSDLRIANTLFEYLDYTDESEFDLFPIQTDSAQERQDILRYTTRINPYKIRSFVERINDEINAIDINDLEIGSQVEIETTPNDGKNLTVVQAFESNGSEFITFDRLGLLISVGQRLLVNTKDYQFSFQIIVTDIATKTATGVASFSENSGEINISTVQELNQGRYIIGSPPNSVIVNKEIERFSVLSLSTDEFTDRWLTVVNLAPRNILISLDENVVVRREIPFEDNGVPPGIGNSSRANVNVGIPVGFEAIREINNPFSPEGYCARFKSFEECQNIVDRDGLNYRSDGLNRNPFATVDDFRYADELPLGVAPVVVETNPLKDALYQEFWDEFQNTVPNHGCLEFQRTGRPELVAPCLAVQRCTRKSPNDRSRVFSCVRDTIGGRNR